MKDSEKIMVKWEQSGKGDFFEKSWDNSSMSFWFWVDGSIFELFGATWWRVMAKLNLKVSETSTAILCKFFLFQKKIF